METCFSVDLLLFWLSVTRICSFLWQTEGPGKPGYPIQPSRESRLPTDTAPSSMAYYSKPEFMHHGSNRCHFTFYPVFKTLVMRECFMNCQWMETQGNWAAGRLPISVASSADMSARVAKYTWAALSQPHSSLVSSTLQNLTQRCKLFMARQLFAVKHISGSSCSEKQAMLTTNSVTNTVLLLTGLTCQYCQYLNQKKTF